MPVKNYYDFKTLDGIYLECSVTDGKETIETFTIDSLHTEPGVEEILMIPHSAAEWKDNRDYYLNISVREKKETAWAPAGMSWDIISSRCLRRRRSA